MTKIAIDWRPYIAEIMPRKEREIVTLTKISIMKPPRKILLARRWVRKPDGSFGFLFPRKENIKAYALLREFHFLPWKPFAPEEMPAKKMDLLFYDPLFDNALYRMKTDRWVNNCGVWETEEHSEKNYAHWCPLSAITLPGD